MHVFLLRNCNASHVTDESSISRFFLQESFKMKHIRHSVRVLIDALPFGAQSGVARREQNHQSAVDVPAIEIRVRKQNLTDKN